TNVQVAAVLRNGRLVDVRALRLPNLDARSRQISAMAAPLLRLEAIAAGSAAIDTVSGATYTSEAYAQSLQAALDAAH
ncbi:MAG: FMN-binding protein, partial [Aeromicrobium sp.]|nr:FMN-binding protein [Aeromicrobium sp.]